MKSTLILTILISLNFLLANHKQVLFLGNSYTYFNDLPSLVDSIAIKNGDSFEYESNTPGGYTLNGHLNNQTSLNLLNKINKWDSVILQEQSQLPVIEVLKETLFAKSAQSLDSIIKLNNSETTLFLTWGRRYGGVQYYNGYSSVDFIDFFHYQDSLTSSYSKVNLIIDGNLAPVGEVFREFLKQHENYPLWIEDNSHPSLEGSYLAALTIYYTLYKKEIETIFNPGIDQDIVEDMLNAIYTVMGNTDLNENQIEKSKISLYPNPFNSTLSISFDSPKTDNYRLEIRNSSGELIKSITNLKARSTIDFKNNSSGIYYISLYGKGDEYYSKKVVLIK
ncbi:MAG: hypothetical protein CR982_06520 [Candidatus Cloacimonadota bacterium]|nr:MAG: hypothetical protein CR982_06520 [Candidatus Cloacimonadota bacterium]PIE79943.1 MAG: hypothetical protein CSA15_02440 [Candidatus Delongbacteria bacterium]